MARPLEIELSGGLYHEYHHIHLDTASPISGVSTIRDDQSEILRALNVKKPAA